MQKGDLRVRGSSGSPKTSFLHPGLRGALWKGCSKAGHTIVGFSAGWEGFWKPWDREGSGQRVPHVPVVAESLEMVRKV